MSAEDNKAIMQRVLQEVVNQGKLELVDQLVAPEYRYSAPGVPEFRGPEGYKQNVSMYRSAFPDMRMAVDDIVAEGDKVVVRWTATGTHRGELMGIAPTGKQIRVLGVVISRLAGGKIVEEHEVFDSLGVMQQLGVVPAPEEATA